MVYVVCIRHELRDYLASVRYRCRTRTIIAARCADESISIAISNILVTRVNRSTFLSLIMNIILQIRD